MIRRRTLITKPFRLSLVVVWLLAIASLGIGCYQPAEGQPAGGRPAEVRSVDFTATPTEGSPPLTVQFTNYSTAKVTDWWWFFGDGHSSSEPNPSHTYAAEGYYTVSLIGIRDGNWATHTKEDYIRIGTPISFPVLKVQSTDARKIDVLPTPGPTPTRFYVLDLAGEGILYWTNYRVMDKLEVDEMVPMKYEHSIWVDANIECYGMVDGVEELWEFQQKQTRRPDAFYPAIYYKGKDDTKVYALWRVNIPFHDSLGFALESNSDYGVIRVTEATVAYGLVVSGMSSQQVFGYGEEWTIGKINEDIAFPVAPKIRAALEKEFGERVFSVAIISGLLAFGEGEYFQALCVDAPDIPRDEIKHFISEQGFIEFIPPAPPRRR